jgi:hypothetical protein
MAAAKPSIPKNYARSGTKSRTKPGAKAVAATTLAGKSIVRTADNAAPESGSQASGGPGLPLLL